MEKNGIEVLYMPPYPKMPPWLPFTHAVFDCPRLMTGGDDTNKV